ncbi:HK97 family phage prohead protease [Rhizobiaceae sp. 2RAB30]
MAGVTFSGTRATGYAAVFNTWTRIASLFDERLAPGAFARTLRESPDVLALWNHEDGAVLGRTISGTLRLFEDSQGLGFELDLDPRSPVGALALSALERGDVAGCSFGFAVRAEEWDDKEMWERPRRTITDVRLDEVTLTAFPAYPTTSASLHTSDPAANAANARRRVIERMQRDHRLRGIA